MTTALHNIRVLDLSRVLAGPFCTQILGDLGAEIIKVEKPGGGDDTRAWGPPFVQSTDGQDTAESAYYLSCNRNKRSIAVDIRTTEGQRIVRDLIAQSDVVIENFKVGGLRKYGLSYADLKDDFPGLIYCSITGFGQNGPLSREPGYDFLAQAMMGLMANTGPKDGPPSKAGVALSDIMTGLNAAIGILAALNHRHSSGQGQHIDVALNDCTLASLTNIAQYYLTSGRPAPRVGNAHATIVPYQAFEAADGYLIVAVGNNDQFARFAAFAGHPEWADDPRFARNRDRVENRAILVSLIQEVISKHSCAYWIEGLHAADVPCGPVNDMAGAFEMEQTKARDMRITMAHPHGNIDLVGSPLKLSQTPVRYDLAPPTCGQHTEDILKNLLDVSSHDIAELKEKGIVQ